MPSPWPPHCQETEWGKPWCVAALQHLEVEFDATSPAASLKTLLEQHNFKAVCICDKCEVELCTVSLV